MCAVAESISIQATMSRFASRQIFRANTERNTLFQYYLKNDCYPLLYHIVQGIYNISDIYVCTISLMFGFIPCYRRRRDNSKRYNRILSRWSANTWQMTLIRLCRRKVPLMEKKMGISFEKQSPKLSRGDRNPPLPHLWHVPKPACATILTSSS